MGFDPGNLVNPGGIGFDLVGFRVELCHSGASVGVILREKVVYWRTPYLQKRLVFQEFVGVAGCVAGTALSLFVSLGWAVDPSKPR